MEHILFVKLVLVPLTCTVTSTEFISQQSVIYSWTIFYQESCDATHCVVFEVSQTSQPFLT